MKRNRGKKKGKIFTPNTSRRRNMLRQQYANGPTRFVKKVNETERFVHLPFWKSQMLTTPLSLRSNSIG
jgi:hypothetical protein